MPTPRVVAEGQIDQIVLLGQEFLTFLAATVVVVPVCNRLKVSPILGFLLSGFLLDQTGCVPYASYASYAPSPLNTRRVTLTPVRSCHCTPTPALAPRLTSCTAVVLTGIRGGARLLSQEGDLGELSELGVLFLLFEMGLELNIDRLTVPPLPVALEHV